MKAWFIRSYGGPDVLAFGDVPEPVVHPRDVLVDIQAASINPIDIRVRTLGAYVAATASTTKQELVRSLGADETIDYKSQDFAQTLHAYDMVFDSVKEAIAYAETGHATGKVVVSRDTGFAGRGLGVRT